MLEPMTIPPAGPTPQDFDDWNTKKKAIHTRQPPPFFHVREIWWCAIGVNVGFEEDGKGSDHSRPVVIVQKFGAMFYGIPLSTTARRGQFYYPFTYKPTRGESVALLTHMRPLDARRLIRKDGVMNQTDFDAMKAALHILIQ